MMNSKLFPLFFAVIAAVLHAAEPACWQNDFDTEAARKQVCRNVIDHDATGGVGGSGCLRFHNDTPKGYPPSVALNVEQFKGKSVVLSAMIRADNLVEPENQYCGPKVCLYYKTVAGKTRFIECPKSYGTYDWKRVKVNADIPADVTELQLLLGVQRCQGTFWIDQVCVKEAVENYANAFVTGSMDKDDATYAIGEPMKFSFRLLDGKTPIAGRMRLTLVADDGRNQTWDADMPENEPLVITTSLAKPGFVMIRCALLDENGNVVKRKNPAGSERVVQWGLGAGVEPQKLTAGEPVPADFDAFWAKQRAELAKVPLTVLKKSIQSEDDKFIRYDVTLQCIGPRPSTCVLVIPKGAGEKSLPLNIRLEGYGVMRTRVVSTPNAIELSVNPHGIENSREDAYYDGLRKGELSGYGFNKEQNKKPETVYFLNMLLRDLRAVEYGKTLPEWNGRNIVVMGGSQGGFQSIAVSALDSDVTECHVAVPWFCDLGGINVGRARGWRPDWTPALGYFDTVNFATRIKCKTIIAAGLSDWVCPPSGVWVLYNNINAPKELTMRQGQDHAAYHGYDHNTAVRSTVKAN